LAVDPTTLFAQRMIHRRSLPSVVLLEQAKEQCVVKTRRDCLTVKH